MSPLPTCRLAHGGGGADEGQGGGVQGGGEVCLSLSVFCPDHMLLIESPRASHTSEKNIS